MKLQQYIIEGKKEAIVQKGIRDVYDNCMPFIKDLVKGGFNYSSRDDSLLYSGRNKTQSIIVGDIRKDRQPKDMSDRRHEIYDKLFYKKFGIKARSNSLFCSGRFSTAVTYGTGKVYMIFPINQYKILWSDHVSDLYNSGKADMIFKIHNYQDAPEIGKDIELEKEIDKEIISQYQTDDLIKAIRSNKEIMLSGNKYIGLEYELFNKQIRFYIQNFGIKYPTPEILKQVTDLWPI